MEPSPSELNSPKTDSDSYYGALCYTSSEYCASFKDMELHYDPEESNRAPSPAHSDIEYTPDHPKPFTYRLLNGGPTTELSDSESSDDGLGLYRQHMNSRLGCVKKPVLIEIPLNIVGAFDRRYGEKCAAYNTFYLRMRNIKDLSLAGALASLYLEPEDITYGATKFVAHFDAEYENQAVFYQFYNMAGFLDIFRRVKKVKAINITITRADRKWVDWGHAFKTAGGVWKQKT